MPSLKPNKLFERLHEWTKRKHEILDRYVGSASQKLSRFHKRPIALVDGFAGANCYGGDNVTGSTVIMVRAATALREDGREATVYACEPDPGIYEKMKIVLAEPIAEGALKVFPSTHAEAVPRILDEIGASPSLVFLDPQKATQLSLQSDIMPWARRPNTDVLGVFFGGQACRNVGQMLSVGTVQETHPSLYLGDDWRSALTEENAFSTFRRCLVGTKRYVGLYHVRKLSGQNAYAIFGISDSVYGYALLSNAVAIDFDKLQRWDSIKADVVSGQLAFEGMSIEETGNDSRFRQFVQTIEPVARDFPHLSGEDLACAVFKRGIGIQTLFGQFPNKMFTKGRNKALGKDIVSMNAKSNAH